MADAKISALAALAGTGVTTSTDVLAIVDLDAGATKKILIDELRIALMSNSSLTNSLSADVDLNNISNYFTGPTCAQGTTGTWFATGTVTLQDVNGTAAFSVKLWDGTTVIDSAYCEGVLGINARATVSLSGKLATPAGNIRISVKDVTSTGGKILFNASGESKDSTLTVFRIG